MLPFEAFSGEQKTALGAELAMKLQRQLSKNPLIVVPGVKDMQAVIGNDSSGALTEDRLRETAKLAWKRTLLPVGRATRVRDELSVDLQVFYNFPGDSYFETYAEGTDSDAVVNELARRMEQEIMDKAELAPPAQRPKGRARPDNPRC
ncbi:MAG: hypothetical protein MZU91_05345 [Desulfosudis oleivorans]|nr:hypothetical protein [Desulfosudis oleivorans]